MTRKHRLSITVPFASGLNTEALDPLNLSNGECSAVSNMMEIQNGMRKRLGMTKIGSDVTATATGLFADFYAGAEVLYKMQDDATNHTISKAAPGTGTWTEIFSGTTAPTNRWSYAKMSTYDKESNLLEKCIFTDFDNEPQIYDGTSCVNLSSLCTVSGAPPVTGPIINIYYADFSTANKDSYKNKVEIRRLMTKPTVPSPVTLYISNSGTQCDTWTLKAPNPSAYFVDLDSGVGSWETAPVAFDSITGDLKSGSATIAVTFAASLSTHARGTITYTTTISFTDGVPDQTLTVTLIIDDSSDHTDGGANLSDGYKSMLDVNKLYYTCAQGESPDVTVNRVSIMLVKASFHRSGSAIIRATDWGSSSATDWLTTTPLQSAASPQVTWVEDPDTESFNVTIGDVSDLVPGEYIASIPVYTSCVFRGGDAFDTDVTYTKTETLEVHLVITTDSVDDPGVNNYVPTKAKCVCVFANRLILGNVVESIARPLSDGGTAANQTFPNRLTYSGTGDLTSFDDNNWEDMPERGGSGNIGLNAIKVFKGAAYIFADNAIHRINDTGNVNLPYSFDYDILPIGCKNPDAIKIFNNTMVFPASDGTIRAYDGFKSYVLSAKTLKRTKTDAPTSGGYDSIYNRYVCNSSNSATRLIAIDLRGYKDIGALSTSGVDLSDVKVFEETYPHNISFLASTVNGCYALFTNTTAIYTGKLWVDATYTDPSTTAIAYSFTTKRYDLGTIVNNSSKYHSGGVCMKGNLLYLEVKGFTTTTAAPTTKITVTCYPSGETVVSNVALIATGVTIPIEKTCQDFTVTIEGSTTVSPQCNIYSIDAIFHNVRRV